MTDELLAFTSPESSAVAGAEYDPASLILLVTLRRKGGDITYQLAGVSLRDWNDFNNATSKGQHFNARIRPFYTAKPLAKADGKPRQSER